MNIVDGNNDYLLLEGKFIPLYNDWDIPVQRIKKDLGLSEQQFRKLRRKCDEEGTITLRPFHKPRKPKRVPKNYSPINRNMYKESYSVRYNGEYFCICDTVEEAELTVSKLRECNWDKSQLKRIKKEVKEELL